MPKKKKDVTVKLDNEDLAEAIRRISRAVSSIAAKGMNRKAIVVLLAHDTKLGQKTIKTVLNSLEGLEKQFTTSYNSRSNPSTTENPLSGKQ